MTLHFSTSQLLVSESILIRRKGVYKERLPFYLLDRKIFVAIDLKYNKAVRNGLNGQVKYETVE